MKISNVVLYLCGALLAGLVCAQTEPDSEAIKAAELIGAQMPPDIRVIIDVSGSMKQNDPLNLRRPALELLVQLFPEGSRAGVWTFGQWVNNLVPSKRVDDRWRNTARGQAHKINSVAMYTNIPAALEKAMDDIDRLDPKFKQHIILLTDGVVDISKSAEENARARQRITEQILPALRQAGVIVHTVALSKNADWELLERLAVETNGLAAIAESAEDLTRIFLQAFDAAAPAEQLPLENNRFLVDDSIEEFTALIFRKPGTAGALLRSPDNKQYTQAQHSRDVSWFSQQNYDLITVKKPVAGEWTIQAELEPDSRVTIVSNLSLQVNRLSKSNFIDDEFSVAAVLQEQAENITRPEFLDLVELSVQVSRRQDGQEWQLSLSESNPTPVNGVFHTALTMLDVPAVYDITVHVNGKTFQRQQKQTIEVRSDFSLDSHSSDTMPPNHRLTLIAQNPAINTDTAVVSARVLRPDGTEEVRASLPSTDQKWYLDIDGIGQTGFYKVDFDASGNYLSGTPFSYRTQIEIAHEVAGSEFIPATPTEPEPAVELEPESAPEPEPVSEPATEPVTAVGAGIEWESIGLYAGLAIGNLLVLALGFFAYKIISSGNGASGVLEQEEESLADDEEDANEAPPSALDDESELEVDLDNDEDELMPDPEPIEEDLALEEIDDLDVELVDADSMDNEEPDQASDNPAPDNDDERKKTAEVDDLDDILDLPDDAIDIDPASDDK